MIKNNNFFVAPPKDESDFKELILVVAASGAGLPVDKWGSPVGQWTPELLAEAISTIDANHSGIDIRTVQHWFQDNDKGISVENIRWLAKIFGCGNAEATSEWQVALSASRSRLISKRRERRRQKEHLTTTTSNCRQAAAYDTDRTVKERQVDVVSRRKKNLNLANRSEAIFCGTGSLNLPIAIWAYGGLLWLLVYIAGLHKVTYSPVGGLSKQVGFLWAPSWTIDRLVFIPLFVITVTGLLKFWKRERRTLFVIEKEETADEENWASKVSSFSFAFWAILIVCLVVVFFVQWSGVYLRPLLRGSLDNSMVDWILVAIVRTDVVTIAEAIALSGLANLYSALAYWCYFCGLLLLYMVVHDFCDNCDEPSHHRSKIDGCKIVRIGTNLVDGVFRCTVFGIFSATCIKLNAVYLISDAGNILSWLTNDALTFLSLRNGEWGWLTQSPPAFMTSFFVLFITCFIFFICLAYISRVFERSSMSNATSDFREDKQLEFLVGRAKVSWMKMTGVVILLTTNFLLIGQFSGFSILLAGSVIVATYSIAKRERSSA